jgi:hypothetical protein
MSYRHLSAADPSGYKSNWIVQQIREPLPAGIYLPSLVRPQAANRAHDSWRETVIELRKSILAIIFVILAAAFSAASDIYVAQNQAGGNTGADCADAHSAAWFNSSANWGSGGGQIGPGTTVHLCGNFTGSANSTMLTVQGNGSSGNPVVIFFENGADLNAPYWGGNGAIACSNHNYITIDGNNTGIIENTANGTSLSNQQSSKGMYFDNCDNIEVKNLTIRNIYKRDVGDTSANGSGTYEIFFGAGSDHISVHDSNLSQSRNLIFVAYQTVTDVEIYNVTGDYSSWMFILGDNNSNASGTGILIHDNTLGPHINLWLDGGANTMHADGIMVFAANSNSSATAQIYNNYVHGDMCSTSGVNCTGYIYVQGNQGTQIFNNVVVAESGGGEGNIVVRGNSPGLAPTNTRIYNNTLVGPHGTVGIKNGGGMAGTGMVVQNNVFVNLGIAMIFGPNSTASLSSSDHNDFFGVTKTVAINGDSGPEHDYMALSDWQAQGFDSTSTNANPNLTPAYVPNPGSAVIGLAANLTSLGIAALNFDKAGTARPSSGPWNSGAYQTAPGSGLAPPTGLQASVQ